MKNNALVCMASSTAPTDTRLASLWMQFNIEFPTEEACLQALSARIHPDGMIKCHHCRLTSLPENFHSRALVCRMCKRRCWLTAGTFFQRIRYARPWLAAIWLMEHGLSLSSSKFHKLLGIAYSTALSIFKKLTIVIQGQVGQEARCVPSSVFADSFGKRSRETPARSHPLGEQQAIEEQLSKVSPFEEPDEPSKKATTYPLKEHQKRVYELLSAQPQQFDILCRLSESSAGELSATLMMLELEGLVARLPGDRYVCNQDSVPGPSDPAACSAQSKSDVASFLAFVRLHFHAISRKYLQNYLSAFWCHTDRTRWGLGSLLDACLKSPAISYRQILDYVSPITVNLVPADEPERN
jgi:hypothetical protein